MNKTNKPALGLQPRDIWDLQRLREIEEAIQRYISDGQGIPKEWIEEHNELIDSYNMTTNLEETRNKTTSVELVNFIHRHMRWEPRTTLESLDNTIRAILSLQTEFIKRNL